MKRLGQKFCVVAVLSLAFVAIWHDAAQAAIVDSTTLKFSSLGQIKDKTVVNPTRIDVDAAGTIYLCDGNVNGVTRYDKYGRVLPTLKGAYRVKSNGVAVTPDGSRVFVSVAAPDKLTPTAVAVINGSTGELIGYLGAGLDEFKRVVEIDLDGNGNIYVGNFDRAKTTTNLVNTARVDVYDGTTYAKIRSFGGPATSLVSGYYRPLPGEFGEIAGLTVDVANQEVLIAEGWNNDGIARVQIFGLNGTFKRLLPETTIAGTQINCKPSSLTVDSAGRVYMLSILTSTIHVFTTHPTEAYLGKMTSGTPDPAYDAAGNVYPWTAGMIPTPSFDTVFDPLTGRLFVVTDGNGIQIFSVNGSTNPPANINTAPQAPGLSSPVQDGEVATLTPTLQWDPAVDAENDPLKYNVKIEALNGTTVLAQNNITATSFAVPAGILLENNSYRWQVQAADAEFTTAYSASRNFWVNAVEEAPGAVSLDAPNPAATVNKNTVFSWTASTDVDPFDTVTYRLEIAQDTSFATPLITVNQSGLTSVALSALPNSAVLKAGATYLWRVVAVDSTGLTRASGYRSFDCNSAPAAPALLSPVQSAEVATLTPTLQWAEAVDADGDTLTYNVQLLDANGTSLSVNNNVTATSLAVAGGLLAENNQYGWQVQAADLELSSAFSAVESFRVNTVEEAPTAALLLGPAAASTVDKDAVFSWQAATDPDPLAVVTYRLEISGSEDFTSPVISVQQSELNSATFSTLPGYADLKANNTYQWRVVAVDNSGLSAVSEVRSFNYVSTTLTIDATFPGAKVYLGGNSAYSGRYVGKTPVEVRDLNSGTIEVVVERPGFEPWISSVVVNKGESVSVNAQLVVAILPGQFLSSPLLASGVKIQGDAEAAPVVVDFDSNGIADLLVADGSGKLLYYAGADNTTSPVNAAVQFAAVTLPAGAAPFVADWNNDDRKDLLVGAADGSVSLYLNVGTQNSPIFADPVQLEADNAPLSVGTNATPLLFDLNDDGAKDLIVGSGDGALYSFLNVGTDADPVFAAGAVLIKAVEGAANAAATVVDWDADGSKEILLANNVEVAVYSAQSDGTYKKLTTFAADQSIYNTQTRKYEVSPANFGEMIRLVSVNFDGISGKDLLFGNATGQILLAKSTSSNPGAISPLFATALLETVAEVETMIKEHNRMTPQVTSFLNQMKTTISSQVVKKTNYYYKAKQFNTSLQKALKADVEVSALLGRLQIQLDSSIPLK